MAKQTSILDSAARLLKKFSLTVFKTNMQSVLYGGGDDDVRRRVEYFAKNRDNDGVELVDMEEEEILQINTPLSGVVDIVRQALEMLAAGSLIAGMLLLGFYPTPLLDLIEPSIRQFITNFNPEVVAQTLTNVWP